MGYLRVVAAVWMALLALAVLSFLHQQPTAAGAIRLHDDRRPTAVRGT
ncbi:unnamed protein product, partial [Musa acuminata subsp. burmannicoides]